jgi:hypothetical protein
MDFSSRDPNDIVNCFICNRRSHICFKAPINNNNNLCICDAGPSCWDSLDPLKPEIIIRENEECPICLEDKTVLDYLIVIIVHVLIVLEKYILVIVI